jgi:hypothetical protein
MTPGSENGEAPSAGNTEGFSFQTQVGRRTTRRVVVIDARAG